MDIDWTTFVFEIVNFLVLVWILKRFLYQPVLDVLQARQERLRLEAERSQQNLRQAEALRQSYETKLAAWQNESAAQRQILQDELAQERARRLEQIKAELATEETRLRARKEALDAAQKEALQHGATDRAYAETSQMLRRLANASLTRSITEIFAEDMALLPPEQMNYLRQALEQAGDKSVVDVAFAHAPDAATQTRVRELLEQALGRRLNCHFRVEPELVAGLRVALGERWLQADLADELSFLNNGSNMAVSAALNQDYRFGLRFAERGVVASVGDGVVWVRGLPSTCMGEILHFEDGSEGLVFQLEEQALGAILLRQTEKLAAGIPATRAARPLMVPVGDALLGRIVDPLGYPLDGLPRPATTLLRPLENEAPAIIERAAVGAPLYTGCKIVDALVPIGKGQRQLVIGDDGVGKSSFALDTVLNQRGRDVLCVMVLVGLSRAAVASVAELLRLYDAWGHTVLVVAEADALPGLRYIAPFAGCALAEHWMRSGRDTLVVYDDLTRHAQAYRELSLLLQRPPGREAYPGDIFYLHARLLERSTVLVPEFGGGSMTALPIAETQQGEIAAYIPTNLISITDGQIYFDTRLFAGGMLPAIDISRSVSRIGGKAQHPAVKVAASRIRLEYLQFLELELFTRFGTRLESEIETTLAKGRILRELLKQDRLAPLNERQQLGWLLAYGSGLFEGLVPAQMSAIQAKFFAGLAAMALPLEAPGEQWQAALRQAVADATL